MNFTDDQTKVLKASDQNLLVSASAGSGKTATVIEKIYRLVEMGEDILSFLVLTFTESASSEMKLRLKDRLRVGAKEDTRLREEIDKISLSDISTLHSFCSKMIRKYYYYLNLKPNFAVLDDNNSSFLKGLALDNLIKKYAKKEDAEFLRLSNIFDGGRGFDSLKKNILSLHEFLSGVEDEANYKKEIALACYRQNDNKAFNFLNRYIILNFNYLKRELNDYVSLAKARNAEFFVEFLSNIVKGLEGVSAQKDFFYNQKVISSFSLPKMTTKKLDEEDASFKEEIKDFWEKLKSRISDIKKFCLSEKSETDIISDLKDAQDFIIKLLSVEEEFTKEYEKIKEKRNALDFSDLERYFLRLLDNPDIQKSLKYKYIFVDEYQDINLVQEHIIKRLSINAKLLMVGDVKQSIYGFRNSTPEIFVGKAKKYRQDKNEGVIIDLNENFRSNKIILDFVNEIFKKCMSEEFGGVDYECQGMLKSGVEYEKCSEVPVVEIDIALTNDETVVDETFDEVYSVLGDTNNYKTRLTNARREAMIVAQKILDIIGKDYYDVKTSSVRKIEFSDIALLARKNDYLSEIALVLSSYKVPISTNIQGNIYKNGDVALLVSLLKIVDNFHSDIDLSVVMTSPLFKFSFDELSKIRNTYLDEKYFYNAVLVYAKDQQDGTSQKLKEFLSEIDEIRESLSTDTLYEILLSVIIRHNYLTFLLSLPDGQNRVKNVEDFVNTFKTSEYNNSLYDFIDYLKNYGDNISFKSSLKSADKSVTLSTIHQSKGLEYPVVFLVGTGEGFSTKTFTEPVLKDKDMGLGINTYNLESFVKTDNVARSAISLHKKREEKAEELRLLYVALTRAKNHLFITGCSKLKNESLILSPPDAMGANNYLEWILSFLSQVNFKNLVFNHKNITQKFNNYTSQIFVYTEKDLEENKGRQVDFRFKNNDEEKSLGLKKIITTKIQKAKKIALKNSVSSILFETEDTLTNTTESPQTLSVFESRRLDLDYARLGTIYHKIMEAIDFNKPFNEEIYNKILESLEIEEKYKSKVNYQKIKRAVESILSLGKDLKFKKELPFISFISYKDIFEDSPLDSKVLVQGVSDLVVEEREKYYLIDYKTTKASTPDQLVEKYFVQLKLYRICLEKALNKRFNGVYIYSFYFEKLIKVF